MADLTEKKAVSSEEEALQKELRALQEARARREEAKRIAELRRSLQEERYEAEEEALEEECSGHERFGGKGERGIDFEILRFGEFLVAFHRPDQAAHKDFLAKVGRATQKERPIEPGDVNNYAIRCLMEPTPEDFSAIAEKFPGAPAEIANQLLELAKGAAKRRKGK